MTKTTLRGLAAALAIVAAPSAQACDSWWGFYTEATYLYDKRAQDWEMCPGMGWGWATTPNRGGFLLNEGEGQGCRTFEERDA